MVTIEPDEIEKRINEYLARDPDLHRLRAHVLPGTVRHEGGYWYVPVGTASDPERKFEYYDKLSDVEEQVKQQDQIEVIIAPSGLHPNDQR